MAKRINCVPPPAPQPVPKADVILELTMEQARYIKAVLGRVTWNCRPTGQVYEALDAAGVDQGLLAVTDLDGGPTSTLFVGAK